MHCGGMAIREHQNGKNFRSASPVQFGAVEPLSRNPTRAGTAVETFLKLPPMNSIITPLRPAGGAVDVPLSNVPTSEHEHSVERTLEAAHALFEAGCIAMLSHEPRPVLVGDMRWVEGTGLLLFTAYGDSPADAHLLLFDDAIVNASGSVTFMCDGHVGGALHRIEDADVDDADDYRVAWRLWQQVAPLHERLIERCYAAAQQADRG